MVPWLHQIAAQFATALLLTGALFDGLGLFRKTERFLFVSFWNLLLGTVAAFAAVGTGLASQFELGPHSQLGDALLGFHRFGGYVVAVCAMGLTITRLVMRGSVKPGSRSFYLAVGLFSAVLLLTTGALGTTLVLRYGLGIDRETAQRVLSSTAEAVAPTKVPVAPKPSPRLPTGPGVQ